MYTHSMITYHSKQNKAVLGMYTCGMKVCHKVTVGQIYCQGQRFMSFYQANSNRLHWLGKQTFIKPKRTKVKDTFDVCQAWYICKVHKNTYSLKLLEKKTALHAVEVHVLVHLIVGNNVTLDICHFKKLNSLKTVKRCSILE